MSFDRVAVFYEALETIVFARALQRARTAFIPQLGDCGHVLIGGSGNGRFLAALLATNPRVRVTCIDASAKMIAMAKERIASEQQLARVTFINADVLTTELPADCDFIVTNFFLDCFDAQQLRCTVDRLACAASKNAQWIVAEFALPPRGVVRAAARLLVRLMYLFFRLATGITANRLPSYQALLRVNGFRRVTARRFFAGMVVSELWRRS